MDKIGPDGWAGSARGLPNMSLPEMNLQIETKSGWKIEKNRDRARASVSKEPSFIARWQFKRFGRWRINGETGANRRVAIPAPPRCQELARIFGSNKRRN